MSATQYAGVAGTWTMDLASAAPPAERYFTTDGTTESLFDPNYRTLVDDNDIKDGGKYRCESFPFSRNLKRRQH